MEKIDIVNLCKESPSKENLSFQSEFQNFVKGKYNQGRKNLLASFLKKKTMVLLRKKITKNVIPKPKRPTKLKSPENSFEQLYRKLRLLLEEYYEKNKSNILKKSEEKNNAKRPYSLLEDIKLLLVIDMGDKKSLENYDNWFDDGFEEMIKNWGFLRSLESLRDRHKRFLKKMTLEDWVEVTKRIEANGLEKAVILFEGSKNDKKFLRVQYEDKSKLESKNSEKAKSMTNKICKESLQKILNPNTKNNNEKKEI